MRTNRVSSLNPSTPPLKVRGGWVGILTLILFLLSSCGGADIPFTLVQPGNGPGQTPPPPPICGNNVCDQGETEQSCPQDCSDNPQGGCVINFTRPTLIMKTKFAAGTPDTDATGTMTTTPRQISTLKFHFNGNQVAMIGDEFDPATIRLGQYDVTLRQKAGTQARGTYNHEEGLITLNGVEFEITNPLPISLPVFTLTTESTGEIRGRYNNLTEQGQRLNSNTKSIKLVAGFTIPSSFPEAVSDYRDVALTISLEGSFDRIPDPATCSGSNGGGVKVQEVLSGDPPLRNLGENNTLNFGSLFIPEQGVDDPSRPQFTKIKTIRVTNTTTAEIIANVSNSNGFTITPSGAVRIAPNANQDFRISLSLPAMAYTSSDPPTTRSVTSTLTFGNTTVNLTVTAKRAAPELTVVEGLVANSPTTLDLGTGAMLIDRHPTLRRQVMLCADQRPPVIAHKLVLQNNGVRPLNIIRIPSPEDTDTDNYADPGCPNYGREFERMALEPSGRTTCEEQTIAGRRWRTDNCTLPPGERLSFKVVYLPRNANTAENGSSQTQDTARLTITSNDPTYAQTPFTLELQGAVSKDTSNLVKMVKIINNSRSSYEIGNGGSVSINIPNATQSEFTQPVELLNRSLDDRLQNVRISFEGANAARFSAPMTLSDIPPQGGGRFSITFRRPEGSDVVVFPARMIIQYVPASTRSASRPEGINSRFVIDISGTVALNPLSGNVKLEIDFLSTFVISRLLPGKAIDSLDFRRLNEAHRHLKSGPIRLTISGGSDVREVNLRMSAPSSTENAVDWLARRSRSQRADLVRIFTSKMSRCSSSGAECPNGPTADVQCNDPEDITRSYQPGDCSFFYYLIDGQLDRRPGTYNVDTGELILPDLRMRFLNPYHAEVAGGANGLYPPDARTNTELRGTLTTGAINAQATATGVPLAFISDFLIPSGSLSRSREAGPCPENWNPRRADSPTPKFACYTRSTNETAYLSGKEAQFIGRGEQSVVLVMVTKFLDNQNAPDFVPPFLSDGRMWVAIQGRLVQCRNEACTD